MVLYCYVLINEVRLHVFLYIEMQEDPRLYKLLKWPQSNSLIPQSWVF